MVIGREPVLLRVEQFLGALAQPCALVLEGGPGIGKTTVWTEACRLARTTRIRVLSCRPAQPEVSLAFSGLVDLFEGVSDEQLEPLPEPQRDALRIALRRASPEIGLPDPLTVAAGARTAIARLAASGPLVIAIDDAHWLDPSTADVIAYVLRRLTTEPIALVLARRPSVEEGAVGQATRDGLPVERVDLEPLSLSSLHHVIREQTGHVVPRPMLHRIAEVSAGNPLFAIGLASALYEDGVGPASGAPMPAPRTLMDLVSDRLRRLDGEARAVLLALASLTAPTEELVEQVVGHDPAAAFDAARADGILDRRVDVPTFAHPLYAECVLQLASTTRRRRVHATIAALSAEPEARARHLALSVPAPDPDVAKALEAGSAAARHRGALRAAAELLVDARRFTPDDERAAAHRRAFDAAELTILAGDRGAARSLLRDVVADAVPPIRQRAMGLLAEILLNDGEAVEAVRLLQEARATVSEPQTAARIELDLAYACLLQLAIPEAATHAAASVELARSSDVGPLLAEALAYEALTRLLAGLTVDEDAVSEALQFEDLSRPPYMGLPPSGVIGLARACAARHAEGRALLAGAGEALDALGDDCDLAHVLLWSSWLELRSGRLAEAASLARNAATMAETTGSELLRAWSVAQAALVEAHRGLGAATDALLLEARRGGSPQGGLVAVWLAAAEGLARLSEDDSLAASAAFAAVVTGLGGDSMTDPVLAFFVPDAAEALAAGGSLKEAVTVLQPFELVAERRGATWAQAAACRARAATQSAGGDIQSAAGTLRDGLGLLATVDMPLERARILLALGRMERRLGERRNARASLESAEAIFASAGATGWARQARTELGRVPGRRHGDGALTPTELRVAELSGSGRTNRDVAATLFVSPKTVEANLARVYRKLGIATRAELGSWLAGRAGDPGGPTT